MLHETPSHKCLGNLPRLCPSKSIADMANRNEALEDASPAHVGKIPKPGESLVRSGLLPASSTISWLRCLFGSNDNFVCCLVVGDNWRRRDSGQGKFARELPHLVWV